jgi:hypothetical protein
MNANNLPASESVSDWTTRSNTLIYEENNMIKNNMKLKPYFSFAALAFLLCSIHAQQALANPEAAATLKNLSGVVFVQHAQGRAELAFDDMAVGIGDTITTERDASVMLVFADKGQLALRPESKFLIKAFHYAEAKPTEDNLVIALLKGGLRTITGYISKRGNRNAYRLESANATMGIRGTDYTARLCEKDCEIEQAQRHAIEPSPSGTIGRVAELEGNLTDIQLNAKPIAMTKSDPFFENDELRWGQPAMLCWFLLMALAFYCRPIV